ncbi:MAG: beta-ketoacyl-ACP synthase 3, partial [Methyloligellaceae bacterium]
MSKLRSVIKGCGSYLPEKVLTNHDLSKMVDTSDEWISERTGIHERHIAADDEYTSDLGLVAAKRALEDADIPASEVDLIILATSTPDQTFPATATTIQAELGIHEGAAFDVQAVCSGFVYALATADNFLKSGQHKCALVIGSETFSRILDWSDRGTCVLFGDGAGAVVVRAEEPDEAANNEGIIASRLRSDGRYRDKLYVDGGPSTTQS